MFLSFPAGSSEIERRCEEIYIPLCFYYFDHFLEIVVSLVCIYIPLCFYYFSLMLCRTWAVSKYLHSIMFLLFPTIVPCHKPGLIDLHSIMFLLFLGEPDIYGIPVDIYIPLCFYYFFQHSLFQFGDLIFTFHYVSIISSACIDAGIQTLKIYIPLCFYYFVQIFISNHTS